MSFANIYSEFFVYVISVAITRDPIGELLLFCPNIKMNGTTTEIRSLNYGGADRWNRGCDQALETGIVFIRNVRAHARQGMLNK